jgi:hypothetical protein
VIDSALYDDVKPGHSRQLTAAQPPDYTVNDTLANWCEAAATEFEPKNFGTPGQDNDCTPVIVGQCSDGGTMRETVPPAPGDLVITEIMPNPQAATDTVGEWFEIRAMKDVDLNGIGLDRVGGPVANPELVESGACLRLTTGSYAVFAHNTDPLMNGGLMPKGTFRFSLVTGSAAAPGDVRILHGTEVIDAVTWPSSRNGRSLSLDPDFTSVTGNDDIGNFCDGTTVYNTMGSVMDFGTPGAANPQCAAQPQPGQCLEGGTPRAIVKPSPGQLVITEFLANPAGTGTDAAQEWFEIANLGNAAFDLNGLSVQATSTANTVSAVDCKRVPAGGFALFAHSTDPATNGGLPAVDATFTFALVQSNGTLSVKDGTTLLDAITWGGTQDGASAQVKPGEFTTTANDDPANFCTSGPTQGYGTAGNYGTPKAVNACP